MNAMTDSEELPSGWRPERQKSQQKHWLQQAALVDPRGNVAFDAAVIDQVLVNEVLANPHGAHTEQRRLKQMTREFDEAQDALNTGTKAVIASIDKLRNATESSSANIKKSTAQLKDYQNQLSDVLVNFHKKVGDKDLEKYVLLTERLVVGLTALADLEQRGLLDKVMKAMSK